MGGGRKLWGGGGEEDDGLRGRGRTVGLGRR